MSEASDKLRALLKSIDITLYGRPVGEKESHALPVRLFRHELKEILDERERMIEALREAFNDSGYCAMCHGHHYEDGEPCPIMEPT